MDTHLHHPRSHPDKRIVSLQQLRKEKAKERSIAKRLESSGSGSSGGSGVSSKQHDSHHGAAKQTTTTTTATAAHPHGPVRNPFCIVWAPLPVISWFFPLIGHTGITNSHGIIYDFSDDFSVTVNHFTFGEPTKLYQFDPALVHGDNLASKALAWDQAIQVASNYYCKTRHSFCFNNCHQYIASVLNKTNYAHTDNWNQHHVWRLITFHSRYTSCMGFVRQWWPFTAILCSLIAVGFLLI